MKTTANNLMNTFTSGLFLVLPFLFFLLLLMKITEMLLSPTKKLADAIGLKAISIDIFLLILLVLACFISGFLIRSKSVRKAKRWLEKNVLRAIPGYEYVRMRLASSLDTESDENPEIVLITFGGGQHPALIIEKNEDGTCVVFVPNAPNLKGGTVIIADPKIIQPLNLSMNDLAKCLHAYGKGIMKGEKAGPDHSSNLTH